jgi:hypothetical protein
LAEVFGHAVPVSNGLALGNVWTQDVALLKQAVKRGSLLRFNAFFRLSGTRWNHAVTQGSADIQYLEAWALIQFLLYGGDGRHQQGFLNFLELLNQGTSWQNAFARAFDVRDYQVIEKHFLKFINDLTPSDLELAVPRMILLAEGAKALAARGERFNNADAVASRLKTLGYQCDLPREYGGGTFSTRVRSPFKLHPHTGGELELADRTGRVLHQGVLRPCVLSKGLQPRKLLLRWKTDGSWEIIVND